MDVSKIDAGGPVTSTPRADTDPAPVGARTRAARRYSESAANLPEPAPDDPEAGFPVPGHRHFALPVARIVVVVLLVALGSIVGAVSASRATPSWSAASQVLLRERDYAAVVLGQFAVTASNTPQRSLAAQVLAAQSPLFTNEVARRAGVGGASVAGGLVVTASPDANVVVFTMTSANPAEAVAVAVVAAELEVTTYRDQLVRGLGSIAAPNTLNATQLAQLAQVQSFEQISPSAQVIASGGEAKGGPTATSTGAIIGGSAGAVVVFLLLAGDTAWRARSRRSRS